jgi:hypothetical protein
MAGERSSAVIFKSPYQDVEIPLVSVPDFVLDSAGSEETSRP